MTKENTPDHILMIENNSIFSVLYQKMSIVLNDVVAIHRRPLSMLNCHSAGDRNHSIL